MWKWIAGNKSYVAAALMLILGAGLCAIGQPVPGAAAITTAVGLAANEAGVRKGKKGGKNA